MSDYIQTLQRIRDNMGRKNLYWTSEGVARVLRTGTDGAHDKAGCRAFLSKLRSDSVYRKKWAKEIEAFEAEVGTKLVPFKRTSKNASLFNVSEAEAKTLPPKPETPKANSDLQLTILAVRAMAESGLQYAEIAKVIGKDENTVVALMKVAEAFK